MLAEHVDHVVGIDPDRDRITAAVVAAENGGVVDTAEFATTTAGYTELVAWADTHCDPEARAWSIEGAGSYGSGATEYLASQGEWVIEFDRPTISTRKDRAKTDTLDAVRAAREALGRDRLAQPRIGPQSQALRALTVARDGAQRARVAAINELRSLVVTGPVELRDDLQGLTRGALIDRCARLRATGDHGAHKIALTSVARRIRHLDDEIDALEDQIRPLVEQAAPQLLDETGISHVTAARLIVAWSHPGRFPNEAAFARLAGVAPIEASSGLNRRHRLNRGGDRGTAAWCV
jgi:transposase